MIKFQKTVLKKARYLFIIFAISTIYSLTYGQNCNCDFTIPLTQSNVDGKVMPIKPGDTVCISSGPRKQLRFIDIHGDSLNYVVFKNCGGTVTVENDDLGYGINIVNCKFFRFTGTGSNNVFYGIKVLKTKLGADGLSIDGMSTNYEIDHIEVANTGFAGIKSYTHPTCDKTANSGNFVQRNTIIHDNYIHHTGGEGLYIGHSFFSGITKACDGTNEILFPHELKGVRVYNNRVDSSGWDGMQVSCATENCEIYDNTITNYGVAQMENQNSGIQIGGGTTGKCYNNGIFNGSGNGIAVFGIGENVIFNNLIVRPGLINTTDKKANGIFFDDRSSTAGRTFNFINNTIISPISDGLKIQSALSKNNKVFNNLIIKPGTFDQYKNPIQCYINYNKMEDLDTSSNYFTQLISPFIDLDSISSIKQFTSTLPITNKGTDVSSFGIDYDFHKTARIKNDTTDIGAFENDALTYTKNVKSQISIYPNPNQGSFLVLNNSGDDILKFTIRNLSGQNIYEENSLKTNFVIVGLNGFIRKGIYLIELKTKNKTSLEKFIVN